MSEIVERKKEIYLSVWRSWHF